jgi:hypothetical protein
MEKMENNKEESRIEKGENVIIHAIFTRHGEKEYSLYNPEANLTLVGKKECFEFGKKREEKNMIKPYTSDTSRTTETAELITSGSLTEHKGIIRKRKELSFVYDKNGQFLKDELKIKIGILGENYEKLSDDEKQKRLREAGEKQTDYYLSFGDKKPDLKTYSPIETASGIAKLIDEYITMSGKLKSGSNVDLINATHDFNLAAFLKEAIIRKVEKKETRGFKSINEIGGSIDFNENFEIIIDRKDKNTVSIKMLFRGREYKIDKDRLKELVEIAKKLEGKNDK